MTDFIVSVVHDADVVLRGRRRESREAFRHDVPLSIRDVGRSDLSDAIRIEQDDARDSYVLQADREGTLWRPFVPPDRRAYHLNPLPSRRAELDAQTVDEFATALRGDRPIEFDPLTRRRSALQGANLSHMRMEARMRAVAARHATRLPRLEDCDAVRTLWSDRAEADRRLRAEADNLLLVDGRVWIRQSEPFLTLVANGEAREVRARLDRPWGGSALHTFRLDRLDDLLSWGRGRQGVAAVPVRKGGDAADIGMGGRFEVMRPEVLRRDDAREVLRGRVHDCLYATAQIISQVPSVGIDAYVDLKRFDADPDCAIPTPDLYAGLRRLAEAIAGITGLTDHGFVAQRRFRTAANPVLWRWDSFEIGRYGSDGPLADETLKEQTPLSGRFRPGAA